MTACARCNTTERPIHVAQRDLCRRCYDWLNTHDELDAYPPIRKRRSGPRAQHGGRKLAVTEKCPCDICENYRNARRKRDATYYRAGRIITPPAPPAATPPRGPVARACTPRHPRGECGICDTRRDADAAHKRATRSPLALAILPRPDETWRNDAICTQVDPDLFFPEKGESTLAAKAICRKCTVVTECLEYALANNERFGVWGAMSERERRQINRGAAA